MMRDANLSEVKDEINKLRRFDFKSAAENAIDPDGTMRDTLARPFDVPTMAAASAGPAAASSSSESDESDTAPAAELAPAAAFSMPAPVAAETLVEAPAFIPPDAVRKTPVPDFIPPGTKRWGY
jgi:sec-independent protein translocase protein TatB